MSWQFLCLATPFCLGLFTRTLMNDSMTLQLITMNGIEEISIIVYCEDLDIYLELVLDHDMEVLEYLLGLDLSFIRKTQLKQKLVSHFGPWSICYMHGEMTQAWSKWWAVICYHSDDRMHWSWQSKYSSVPWLDQEQCAYITSVSGISNTTYGRNWMDICLTDKSLKDLKLIFGERSLRRCSCGLSRDYIPIIFTLSRSTIRLLTRRFSMKFPIGILDVTWFLTMITPRSPPLRLALIRMLRTTNSMNLDWSILFCWQRTMSHEGQLFLKLKMSQIVLV